ncbi:hypothetical protein V1503_24615 [Bacillus sp. SCS-151]|uniref:hypothetical protein n=1 Tax=Nanhaiella sioensis TaxID=3115293 RepID=UPI00397A6023
MKKISIALITVLMIMGSLTNLNTLANENSTPMSKENINKIIKEFEDEYNQNTLKNEDREEAKEKIEKMKRVKEKIKKEKDKFATGSESLEYKSLKMAANDDYSEYLNELRQGNYIEGILDLDEGLSETDIFDIGYTYANEARDAAIDYSSNTMLRDAFRHFSWNYLSTVNVGKSEARTATINHEWGIQMIDAIGNYYTNRYNEYIADGYSESDAANKSFIDATLYIDDLKYFMIQFCEDDLSFFKGYFEDSNIMDFTNNHYGREYGDDYPTIGYKFAFANAKDEDVNQLILDEDDVVSSSYELVWKNDWYTY